LEGGRARRRNQRLAAEIKKKKANLLPISEKKNGRADSGRSEEEGRSPFLRGRDTRALQHRKRKKGRRRAYLRNKKVRFVSKGAWDIVKMREKAGG